MAAAPGRPTASARAGRSVQPGQRHRRVPAGSVQAGQVEEVREPGDQVDDGEAPGEDPEGGQAAGRGDLGHGAGRTARGRSPGPIGSPPSRRRSTASWRSVTISTSPGPSTRSAMSAHSSVERGGAAADGPAAPSTDGGHDLVGAADGLRRQPVATVVVDQHRGVEVDDLAPLGGEHRVGRDREVVLGARAAAPGRRRRGRPPPSPATAAGSSQRPSVGRRLRYGSRPWAACGDGWARALLAWLGGLVRGRRRRPPRGVPDGHRRRGPGGRRRRGSTGSAPTSRTTARSSTATTGAPRRCCPATTSSATPGRRSPSSRPRPHGIDGAAETAERAIDLGARPADRAAATTGQAFTADTGGTGLLVAALVEHRRATGDDAHDEVLRQLGRFLAATVTEEGAVVASWDLDADEPVAGSRSPFFTGEILWALARLHAEFPDEGWDEPARRISHYVATERDDAERRFPPVSDHWGAYAWDEISAWPADAHRRGAGLRRAPGRAVQPPGPLRVPAARGGPGPPDPRADRPAPPGWARSARGSAASVAWPSGATTSTSTGTRSTTGWPASPGCSSSARSTATTPATDGAWFRNDITQVDDQQHAVSALLAALPVLEDR